MRDPGREPPRGTDPRGGTEQNRWEADSEKSYHWVGTLAGSLFDEPAEPVAFQRTSATSRAAAEIATPKASTGAAAVYECLGEHGPLTDDEVSRLTGLPLNSERPRRVYLVERGLVVAAGVGRNLNGNKATLWARAGDPRIPHPEGPDESGELLRQIHERRPMWLGDRQLRRLIADALTACGGDQRAALRRVLRDVEQLR